MKFDSRVRSDDRASTGHADPYPQPGKSTLAGSRLATGELPASGLGPGKTTLVAQAAVPVQRRATGQVSDANEDTNEDTNEGANEGAIQLDTGPEIVGAGAALPHGAALQQLFGRRDLRRSGTSTLTGAGPTAGELPGAGLESAKTTLVGQAAVPVQRRATGPASDTNEDAIRFATGPGIAGSGSPLPHGTTIQRLFGRHDVSGVRAHIGGPAAEAAAGLKAHAYTTGNDVAFATAPDLRLAAHEAAHTIQQRSGVSLKRGIDEGASDPHERHADAVAEAVVRGESAEALLDQYSGSGSRSAAVQRFSDDDPKILNRPDSYTVPGRHGRTRTAGVDADTEDIYQDARDAKQKRERLLHTKADVLRYGANPKSDEQTEITGSASYLQQRRIDWRNELQARQQATQNGEQRQENWQSWETFQHEIDKATNYKDKDAEPWFMQPRGYELNSSTNQRRLRALGNDRTQQLRQDDPQEQLGMTYDRDNNFARWNPAVKDNHRATFDAHTDAGTFDSWKSGILRIHKGDSASDDLVRMRIDSARAGTGAGQRYVVITGTSAETPRVYDAAKSVEYLRPPVGGRIEVRVYRDGTVDVEGDRKLIIRGAWKGELESNAVHQATTRIDEAIGQHIDRDGASTRLRNRKNQKLNDEMFERVHRRLDKNPRLSRDGVESDQAELSYRNSLGPRRNPLNFHDDKQVGWDVWVAPYRRLGADTIFKEDLQSHSDRYDSRILSPKDVDVVGNGEWYRDRQRYMGGRFVGGRSNSTSGYMGSVTFLRAQGKLTDAEAQDVMAFIVADMVVSGEHSMAECMTTVVMAASASEPWQQHPVNIQHRTLPLQTWLHLVDRGTKERMGKDADDALWRMLALPQHDVKLVRLMAMLLRVLWNLP